MPKKSHKDRAKARELIKELYLAGFTPLEIEELTEANWKRNTISKYCKGLEVKDTSEKSKVMDLLKEFVSNDGSWEEMEYYVKTKKSLESENLDLDDVIEQKKQIEYNDLNLEDVGFINEKLREKKLKWTEFIGHIELAFSVVNIGYSIEELKILRDKTLENGGIEPTIRTINYVLSEAEIQKEIQKGKKIIENLKDEARVEERRKDELMHQIKINQFYVGYAEKLLNEYNLGPFTLQMILTTAKKFGEPFVILQALNTYGNLDKLQKNVQSKIVKIKAYEDEISNLQIQKENNEAQIADLYRKIGAIEEKNRHMVTLHNVANLLGNPAEAQINPDAFMTISLSLLIGMRDFGFTHSAALPKWDTYIKKHVDNAANLLNNIIVGKL